MTKQTVVESIRLKNYRSFEDAELKDIPPFCVLVGKNGAGKTTLFSVFNFLKRAMEQNITAALGELGGGGGLPEVRTRGKKGDIEIEIKFRPANIDRRVTYLLVLSEQNNRPVVKRERLSFRRGSQGHPWRFLDFSNGTGYAITDDVNWAEVQDYQELNREEQTLKSPDILAIKALSQLEKFPALVAWGELIENWQVFDFHIQMARHDQTIGGYNEILDKSGGNLSLVIDFLYKNHRPIFDKIMARLCARIPGVNSVTAEQTPDGRVLLYFEHQDFEQPILAHHISDGTMRMLAYLVLLYHPSPHSLLGVEEPENQLYPHLLAELAEEFRLYTNTGGQVFLSTHSPDFLNAVYVEEVFLLNKERGVTKISKAVDDPQVKAQMDNGDTMGELWKEGLLRC